MPSLSQTYLECAASLAPLYCPSQGIIISCQVHKRPPDCPLMLALPLLIHSVQDAQVIDHLGFWLATISNKLFPSQKQFRHEGSRAVRAAVHEVIQKAGYFHLVVSLTSRDVVLSCFVKVGLTIISKTEPRKKRK